MILGRMGYVFMNSYTIYSYYIEKAKEIDSNTFYIWIILILRSTFFKNINIANRDFNNCL